MNKYFYEKGSDSFYLQGEFWNIGREAVKKENAILLSAEEANKLQVDSFFSKNDNDYKPRLDQAYSFFALPYEIDYEFEIDGRSLEEFIFTMINHYLPGTKYFASTDSDMGCIIKCQKLTSDLYWGVDSGHLNTPFIVFDEKKEFFALLDYDLPIQIIGYKKNIVNEDLAKKYRYLFLGEWPNVLKQYENYTNLIPIVKEYYGFLFPNNKVPKS